MTGITLVKNAEISHNILEIGKSVDERLKSLNIENQLATEDTVQALKKLRADLTKEFNDYETQRKTVKSAILQPYEDMETLYKKEIADKYKNAGETLKTKITEFENAVKLEKKKGIEVYFDELCQSYNIDFLKFENAEIEINLSVTDKQYREKCNAFVARVSDDIELINTLQYPVEMLTEYKRNGFNASAAIKGVNDRKEAEKLEAERVKLAETQRRQKMLIDLLLIYHDMTKTYNYLRDESIYIAQSDIESFSKEEFQKEYVKIEAAIKEKKELVEAKEEPKADQPVVAQRPAIALRPPVVEPTRFEDKKFKASFEAYGTMLQLKALGEYMKESGITYKNI